MKKGILLGLPLVLICPLMLLMLVLGNANIEAVRAACATTATSTRRPLRHFTVTRLPSAASSACT